jgi:SpoVK/Ycf46/Vps4 family AAA+-type ATPase
MATDEGVIEALRDVLRREPLNAPLHLHLATLLAGSGRGGEALEHCAAAVGAHPGDADVASQAAGIAEAAGDPLRATGYRRLAAALGSMAPSPATAPDATGADPSEALDRSEPAGDLEEPARIVPLSVVDGEQTDESFSLGDVERPQVTLADVGGMDDVKRRLTVSFLAPMKDAAMRQYYGKSLRGGLLLYGPPGCGKTFIARATAGELAARFISVGLADILDMWLGMSERNLHEVFTTARRKAPCVLFLDEVDALGFRRSNQRNSPAGRNVVAQLLSEMDNVNSDNEGVFVLAATNHPWDVDSALRRPGRFDRMLLVVPPDLAARAAIFEYHLRGRPVEGVDVHSLAQRTEGYSGADIAHVCETAAERAMMDSMQVGTVRPIRHEDMHAALREVHPSTAAWFQMARNHAMFANEGGAYDDLLEYIRAKRLA